MENNKANKDTKQSYTLVYAAFIAGLCSIIYELLIATTVSYFLGDSVKYFSLTIGMYMAAMGIGSYVSQFLETNLLIKFIRAELRLALLGGLSIPALYFTYALFSNFFIAAYIFFTVSIGFLIGLEIPFLTRLMEKHNKLSVNIANILSFDYMGALIATTAFPFILLPFLGVYQSSLIFGLINMSIAVALITVFSQEIKNHYKKFKFLTAFYSLLLIGMIFLSGTALQNWDQMLYEDRVIYSGQSRYQRIVMTKGKDDVRLYLDGNLQFSSIDEHRYHEALVQVPLAIKKTNIKNILLLGAGDGLAVRELLKHDGIEHITLVDLDQKIIDLGINNKHLSKLNKKSLLNDKVQIIQSDAFTYLTENKKLFDVIISDLPDPNNNELARLYSKQFYKLVSKSLSKDGLFVTQATSPYFATNAFWSIEKTINAGGFNYTYPYHVSVPSFGEWGFVIGSKISIDINNIDTIKNGRFINNKNFHTLFIFPNDMVAENVKVNNIDRPILLDYYLKGWRYYAH